MITITPEIRRAVQEAGDAPVRLEDPQTHETYVLLRAEVYDRMGAPTGDDLTPEEKTRLMWDVMEDEWSDPSMDVYDSEGYA